MVVLGDLINSWEKKRYKRQRKKIYQTECRVPKNSKKRWESLLKWAKQRDRGKRENGEDWRSHQENWRYRGNISCKDGHNKGQKQQGPNKKKTLRQSGKNTQKNYTKKVLMIQITTMVWSSPDILECEVKWALESITKNKARGGDGIPDESERGEWKSWVKT